jgi:hypothetical protein
MQKSREAPPVRMRYVRLMIGPVRPICGHFVAHLFMRRTYEFGSHFAMFDDGTHGTPGLR